MRIRYLPMALAILLVALAPQAFSQAPPGDVVKVTFDRTVMVGSYTLTPGDYTVQQVTSASNPRVLEFTSNHGTQLDATVTAIPIMRNTPPTQTRVILDEEGDVPHVHRIWVQGRTYGYEIPGHSATAGAQTIALEGSFQANRQTEVVAQAPPPPPTPTPTPEPAPPPQQQPTPTPQPTTPPETNQTPPPQEQAPPPASAQTPEVPSTALDFAPLMFGGFLLASAGLVLYRRGSRKA
jgi:outer membrane biosynthesis protein TonB